MKVIKTKDFINIRNAFYIDFNRYKTQVRDQAFIWTAPPLNFHIQMLKGSLVAFFFSILIYGILFLFTPSTSQNIKIYTAIGIFVFMEIVSIICLITEMNKQLQYKTILFFDKSTNEASFWDDKLSINISEISEIVVITANSLKLHNLEASACSYPSQQLQLKLRDGNTINLFVAKFNAYNTLKLGKKLASFLNIPITHIKGLTYSEAL